MDWLNDALEDVNSIILVVNIVIWERVNNSENYKGIIPSELHQ